MDYIKEAFLLYLEETGAFGRSFSKYDNNFGRFSPTYTVSNERLSEAMEVLKPRGKSVLTVAASGDQAFFYKINGASHVDTFDISYCAQVMMNVKTAAVQTLDYTGYKEFLKSIKSANTDIMSVSKFPKISVALSQDVKRFLNAVRGQKYRSTAPQRLPHRRHNPSHGQRCGNGGPRNNRSAPPGLCAYRPWC